MNILITNDDGINAPVLVKLVEWAAAKGNVTVVAPKFEQSGKSHAIELHKAFEVKRSNLFGVIEAYAVDSTPADCVRFACYHLKKQFDLVISGINRGLNMGEDIAYSGTLGAVFEASYVGINSMALSTDVVSFDNAVARLDEIFDYLIDNKLYDFNSIYNINIPTESKGIKLTKQGGKFYCDNFLLQDDDMYMPQGYMAYKLGSDFSIDTDSVMNGYISITPLTSCFTAHDAFDKLSNLALK